MPPKRMNVPPAPAWESIVLDLITAIGSGPPQEVADARARLASEAAKIQARKAARAAARG